MGFASLHVTELKENVMRLVEDELHFYLIRDHEKFLEALPCGNCDKLFSSTEQLNRHGKTKTSCKFLEIFPDDPRVFQTNENRLEVFLRKIGKPEGLYFTKYFATFDIESILIKQDSNDMFSLFPPSRCFVVATKSEVHAVKRAP
jgi:thiol-disulfide isomerase/thioredoxin